MWHLTGLLGGAPPVYGAGVGSSLSGPNEYWCPMSGGWVASNASQSQILSFCPNICSTHFVFFDPGPSKSGQRTVIFSDTTLTLVQIPFHYCSCCRCCCCCCCCHQELCQSRNRGMVGRVVIYYGIRRIVIKSLNSLSFTAGLLLVSSPVICLSLPLLPWLLAVHSGSRLPDERRWLVDPQFSSPELRPHTDPVPQRPPTYD